MMDVCDLLLLPIQPYFWVNLSCSLSRPRNENRQACFLLDLPPSAPAELLLISPSCTHLLSFYSESCSPPMSPAISLLRICAGDLHVIHTPPEHCSQPCYWIHVHLQLHVCNGLRQQYFIKRILAEHSSG